MAPKRLGFRLFEEFNLRSTRANRRVFALGFASKPKPDPRQNPFSKALGVLPHPGIFFLLTIRSYSQSSHICQFISKLVCVPRPTFPSPRKVLFKSKVGFHFGKAHLLTKLINKTNLQVPMWVLDSVPTTLKFVVNMDNKRRINRNRRLTAFRQKFQQLKKSAQLSTRNSVRMTIVTQVASCATSKHIVMTVPNKRDNRPSTFPQARILTERTTTSIGRKNKVVNRMRYRVDKATGPNNVFTINTRSSSPRRRRQATQPKVKSSRLERQTAHEGGTGPQCSIQATRSNNI